MIGSIIGWIILGAIAGFIASKVVNKTGEGLVMDIVLGIVGAFVGGFIADHLFGGAGMGHSVLSIPSLVVAVLGAILVLIVYHMVVRRRV
jgi:uncharacterized membrane protein YeaQ/YmgE (transglycosylase-associated protein family)